MNTIYLDQSTTIITLLLTSLAFAAIGIVYSRGKLSINSYLNADRSIGKRSLTASLVASCFGVWILIGPSEAATWGGLSYNWLWLRSSSTLLSLYYYRSTNEKNYA